MTDFAILGAVVAATALLAWWWRARDGHVHAAHGTVRTGLRADLGVPDDGWLLLLFTAPSCAPCVSARRLLEALEMERDDAHMAVVDVAEDLDLAKRHHVLRAPTVLLIDEAGAVVARVSGVPDHGELIDVLDGQRAAA